MSQQGDRKVTIELKGVADSDDEDKTVPGVQPGRAVGFRANLAGVSLWDLVQMECLAGSRMVVLVTGEGGIGYLYFDRGQIIHALTTEHTGEEAALEILGWTNGSFQPCERPWPEARTILTSHEAMILEVARRQDEASNLVAFPKRVAAEPARAPVTDGEPLEELELDLEEEGAPSMGNTNIGEVPPQAPARPDFSSTDFPVMLRLAPHGAIIKNNGGTEEQAEMVAYVRRLLELAGDFLGLEGFTALECTFTQGRCLAFVDTNGDTVVLRPRADANLQPLRERLGL
jgi:Domain of unknown function (DUF4388)